MVAAAQAGVEVRGPSQGESIALLTMCMHVFLINKLKHIFGLVATLTMQVVACLFCNMFSRYSLDERVWTARWRKRDEKEEENRRDKQAQK